MTPNRDSCKPELWTIQRLITACKDESNEQEKISIPRFQRRLVWKLEKQKDLIQSIKKGYPIGSLLLYHEGERDGVIQYRLIDGLQRTFAMRQYAISPNQFFDSDDELLLETVKTILPELNLRTDSEQIEKARRVISAWVTGKRGFSASDGWDRLDLIETLHKTYQTELVRLLNNTVINDKLVSFLDGVRKAADISGTHIPVNIYKGDSSKLPEIFELLNSSGVALNKYEIYAARWIDTKLNIKNRKIRQAIREKYEKLNEEGFSVDALDQETDADSEPHYTLFEYLFGLGQFLANERQYLFKPVKEDITSSAGFNLVTASVGLPLQRMAELNNKFHKRNFDINLFEKALLESVDYVNENLKPIAQIHQKNRPIIHHAELQIVSLIASAFQFRYDITSSNYTELSNWKRNRNTFNKHLLMYYLYDLVRDYWRGTGDRKLSETTRDKRYLMRLPTKENWQQVFNIWFDEVQLKMKQRNRYIKKSSLELLMLKYIYTHKLTVMENTKNFHIEHIIPVANLKNLLENKDDGLPINCVANLALLEQNLNLEKGDKNFVLHLTDKLAGGEIDQDSYEEQLKELETRLICRRDLIPIETLDKEIYMKFLRDRFKILLCEFMIEWKERIPNANL